MTSYFLFLVFIIFWLNNYLWIEQRNQYSSIKKFIPLSTILLQNISCLKKKKHSCWNVNQFFFSLFHYIFNVYLTQVSDLISMSYLSFHIFSSHGRRERECFFIISNRAWKQCEHCLIARKRYKFLFIWYKSFKDQGNLHLNNVPYREQLTR